jgi:flagellin
MALCLIALLCISILLPAQPASAQSNLVQNPGFETGNLSGWQTVPTSFGPSEPVVPQIWTTYVHSGTYALDLSPGNGATLGVNDEITQTLATTPGATYNFSFWLLNTQSSGPDSFQVAWNGAVVPGSPANADAAASNAWANYAYSLTATSSTTSISFEAANGPGWTALDDVSVVRASAAPELSTVSMFAAGSVGLVLKQLRGRRKRAR